MGRVYRGYKDGWAWGQRPGKVGGAPVRQSGRHGSIRQELGDLAHVI